MTRRPAAHLHVGRAARRWYRLRIDSLRRGYCDRSLVGHSFNVPVMLARSPDAVKRLHLADALVTPCPLPERAQLGGAPHLGSKPKLSAGVDTRDQAP